MNGPTRSSAFERHGPLGDGSQRTTDLYDELDQFVDSEPAVWGPVRTTPPAPAAPAAPRERPRTSGTSPEPGFATRSGAGDVDPAPAFSSDGSRRRDMFTERLNAELSRPKPRETEPRPAAGARATDQRAGERPRADQAGAASSGAPRTSESQFAQARARGAAAAQARHQDGEGRPEHRSAPQPAPQHRGLLRDAPPARPATTQTAQADGGGTELVRVPQRPDPAPEAEPPADALDLELGHAIGAIISGGRLPAVQAAPEPDEAPPAAPSTAPRAMPTSEPIVDDVDGPFFIEGDLTQQEPDIADHPSEREHPIHTDTAPTPAPLRSRATPIAPDIPLAAARSAAGNGEGGAPTAAEPASVSVNPSVDLSGKRIKPIPAFSYARREDEHEPFPAAPPDLDDPLASVFLSDARDALEQVRPGAYANVGEEDAFEPYEDEAEGDDFDFEDEVDEDDLPPSLARAADRSLRGRRRRFGRTAVLSVAGLAAVALAGIVGVNVFAGPDEEGGEPRVIRADARDVKSRAEDEGSTARPDISERVALGDSDRLVVPETVRIGPQQAPRAAEAAPETRSVRTVVVRPDGTIVPTPLPGETNAQSRTSRPAAPYDVAEATGANPVRSDAADLGPPRVIGASPDGAAPTQTTITAETVGVETSIDRNGDTPTDIRGDFATQDEAQEFGSADSTFDTVDDGDFAALDSAALPRPRPTPPPSSGRTAQSSTPTQQGQAAQTQTQTQTAWAASSSPSAPWGVQVASRRDRADAQNSFRDLARRYPSLLGNVEPMILAADVGDRGTFYRVRIGASSFNEATRLCNQLKGAGADCFVGRN